MKILIANDGLHAHYHERLSWANAFNASGIQCSMYDCKQNPAFGVFDSYEPDIFIGQLYNLDKATIKCIQNRPHLKVALRAGEYNDGEPCIFDKHILKVTPEELSNLDTLIKTTGKPEFIYTHYLQKDIEVTHKKFKDNFGRALVGIPMCADVHTYCGGVMNESMKSDIAFVGGYWPYKGMVLDSFLLPILSDFKYCVKIFGNQAWPCNQYMGMIEDHRVKDLFVSAKVCPNLSEPHAQLLGIDVNERAFKILAAGGFCIMDNVRAAKEIFGDGVVFADNPEDFRQKLNYYLHSEKDRNRISTIGKKIVMSQHTNYHRAALFLDSFKEKQKSTQVLNAYNNYIQ